MWTDEVYDFFDLSGGSPLDPEEVFKCYDPESRQEVERLCAEAVRSGSGFSLDVRIETPKGTQRWIRLTAETTGPGRAGPGIWYQTRDFRREGGAGEDTVAAN